MERNSIYIGEVFQQNFISFQCIRKILFVLNKEEKIGLDLINQDISYPLASNKNDPIYIGQTFCLDETLANLGYPEVLTDEEINKLLNEDFYAVVVESGIYHNLQEIINESSFSIEFYKNNIDLAKNDFIVHADEVKEKPKSFIKRMLQKKRDN